MKRILIIVIAAVLATFALASTASGQDTSTTIPPDTTTTTVAPDTTTTTVTPDTTTTTAPDTTTVPDSTTTTTIPQVDLPGELVTSGELQIGSTFKDSTDSSCTAKGAIDGQQINIIHDDKGKIGAIYGKADLGSTTVGVVSVELGPLPLAITAYRATGTCNQDVVAVGTYDATASTASASGIGYGAFPNDFASTVNLSLTVGETTTPASLNLQSAYDFLMVPRPGQDPTTTVPGA